jgi:hypothetical protein
MYISNADRYREKNSWSFEFPSNVRVCACGMIPNERSLSETQKTKKNYKKNCNIYGCSMGDYGSHEKIENYNIII